MRNTGLDIIGPAPWGTHFCQFYETAEDLLAVLIPYFRAGLENNEYCMWITSEPLDRDAVIARMREAVPAFDDRLRQGQIEVIRHTDWYLKDGVFDRQRVLDGWVGRLNAAVARGYDGLRLTGNTFWLEKEDGKAFAEYEEAVDSVIGRHNILALCTYSLGRCGAGEVIDVVQNHRFALIKRDGAWKLIENAERRRSEEALREREAALNGILNATQESVLLFSAGGILRMANQMALKRLGKSSEEVIGRHIKELLSPELARTRLAHLNEVVRTGCPVEFEDERAGMIFSHVFYPVLNARGGVSDVAIFSRDITDRRTAARALSRSEEKYRLLFENMGEGFALYELLYDESGEPVDWRVLEVNDAYELHTGIARDRIAGRRMSEFYPAAIPEYLPRFAEVVATRQHITFETFSPVADRHLRVVCFPAGPGRFANTITDITGRKRAEDALLQGQKDLARAQEVGNIGSWRLDVRSSALAWSDETHRIFGIPPGTALTYETFLAAVHPDDRKLVDGTWQAALRGGSYDLEHRIIADGRIRWVREKAFLEFDGKGALTGGFGIVQDITDRKTAEEALRKAHDELEQRVAERTRELTAAGELVRTERQRLFSVLETLPVYVILLDRDHHIPFANRFFRERFGDSAGRPCYEYLFGRTEPCKTCETYTVLRTNAPHHWHWTGPDGRDYDIYDYPFTDSDGTTLILEMGIDITDQKQAQQALRGTIAELEDARRRSELTASLLSLITKKSSRKEYLDATCDLLQAWSGVRQVGVRVMGTGRKIPFESCRGYDAAFLDSENDLSLEEHPCICTRITAGAPEPSDLRSMTPRGSFYSEDTSEFIAPLSRHELSRYRGVCMQHRYRSLAVIPILYREQPVGALHLADERPGMLARTTVEFLEQLAQIIGEAIYRFSMEEEQARLASALESSADGVAITHPRTGVILYVNTAFEEMTGYARSEAVGATLHLLDSGRHDEAFFRAMRETLARDGIWRGVLINRKKDGTLYFEECSTTPVRDPDGTILNYVSVKRNITEKLRLESIAESVNSMNNIGYIFAGVRHEIGNPINSAKMMLSVLQHKLETAGREFIRSYVERVLVEIGRVEILLRNLKNFNLYETPEIRDLDLPSFLREFRNLVVEDLGRKGIAFSHSVAAGAERALIDPRALQQVLINLIANASDALAARPEPSIEITVRKEGGLVHLEVADNGAGLTDEQQQNIFKPFYTSKQHGTGLGLVIAKKLLTRMNCSIGLTSISGQGTIIDIAIPEGGTS